MTNVIGYLGLHRSDAEARHLFEILGLAKTDEFAEFKILDYPKRGVSIYLNEADRIVTVFLYSEGRDGHARSVLDLPCGLVFTDSIADVRQKLGAPRSSGVGKPKTRDWDKFERESHSIHVEYEGDLRSISLVTLKNTKLTDARNDDSG